MPESLGVNWFLVVMGRVVWGWQWYHVAAQLALLMYKLQLI